ncbi:MAG: ligase [Burkholderiaceae bacterium]|nr:ligase [Burkholderiaceae bacterium]
MTAASRRAHDVPVLAVDAAAEQAWNEARLAHPVSEPVARLWRYPRPAVVLGRSQQVLAAALAPAELPVITRRAGGGAVLVGPWLLGASIVLPSDHPLVAGVTIPDSYRWLGECFQRALARHGVIAQTVPADKTWKAPAELAWACYAGMSPWEVAIDGRKLVGLAQRRGRHGILFVAGALLEPVPWTLLAEVLRRPEREATLLARATISAAEAAADAAHGAGFDPEAFAADVGAEVAAVLRGRPMVG